MQIETIWLDSKRNPRRAVDQFVDEVNQRIRKMESEEGKRVQNVQYVSNGSGLPFMVVSYN